MQPLTRRFVTDYQMYEAAARVFVPDAIKAQLTGRQQNRCDISDFDLVGLDEDGMIFTVEYNDSCGCHPEYQTASVTIPWADIELQLERT